MVSNNLILRYTGVFCIFGLFFGAFGAMIILGLQSLIASIGIECTKAWVVVWIIFAIVSIIAPIIFTRFLKRNYRNTVKISSRIVLFLLVEYISLIGSIDVFFSDANTLCYVADGQNGMEFIFISWLTIPILLVLALLFSYLQKKYNSRKDV